MMAGINNLLKMVKLQYKRVHTERVGKWEQGVESSYNGIHVLDLNPVPYFDYICTQLVGIFVIVHEAMCTLCNCVW